VKGRCLPPSSHERTRRLDPGSAFLELSALAANGLYDDDAPSAGIVTGIALLSAFKLVGVESGLFTIVVGHATFCIVVVYNNVIARFRRSSPSLVEASMDLGADPFQTFRYVVLPNIATALLAGGMLAFALSFDEIIVTTFTAGTERTLPIWLLNQLSKPRDTPITNVVAMMVMLVTMLPILGAYYLTRGTDSVAGSGK